MKPLRITNKPLISCYTPTYNRKEILLGRAIPSVLNQTYTNIEYIIVSDGSNDNTKDIVESIKDKRVRFFEIERERPHHNYDSEKEWRIGGSYAANFALTKIRGEWIARIDDDDVWTKDHIEKSLKFALDNNYEFITSKGFPLVPPNIQDYLKIYDKEKINPKVGPHSSFFYQTYLKSIKYNTECYKKDWNNVEDPDLLEQMFKKGVYIGFLDEVLTFVNLQQIKKHKIKSNY